MMLLPFSKRRTMPRMSSPLRSLYSLKMRSRSASRTRWMSTCLAVCAAMRPKAVRACFSLRRSPNSLSCSRGLLGVFGAPEDLEAELLAELGLEARRFCASSSAISRSGSSDRRRRRSCTGRGRPGRCPR